MIHPFFAQSDPVASVQPPLIEQVLAQLPTDQRSVCFNFGNGIDGYMVDALLALPTVRLIARTDVPLVDHRAAIDQVVEKLAAKLRRHQKRKLP